MPRKRFNVLHHKHVDSVDFVDLEISEESFENEYFFGDLLQNKSDGMDSSKIQVIRSNFERESVLVSKTMNEQPQSDDINGTNKIVRVLIKPEPVETSNEGGDPGPCKKVAPAVRVKREVPDEDQPIRSSPNLPTIQSKRPKKVLESDVACQKVVTEEFIVPDLSTSIFINLPVKSELVSGKGEEDEALNKKKSVNKQNSKVKDYSAPEEVKLRSVSQFEHSVPKSMHRAITEVLSKKMMDSKPRKQTKKIRNRSSCQFEESLNINKECESSRSSKKAVSSKKKDEEKPKLTWNPELMIMAVNAVRAKKMGSTRAARVFQIPKSMLLKCLNEKMATEEIVVPCPSRGRKKSFSSEEEEDLVKYLLYVQERYFGLTKEDVKNIILQFTKLYDINNPFGVAGQPSFTWINTFVKRHSSIVIQHQRETRKHSSIAKFFALMKQDVEANRYSSNMIFNVDETAFSIVHSKNPQFRLMKRQEQLVRAKKDTYLTVIMCMGAAGNFVPPMFIFPRHKVTTELMKGAPPGAIATCHPSGWVQMELFTQWFRHFLVVVRPEKENPALLILDGQQNHTKNVEVIRLAQENHVSIISLPPLTLTKLQPVYKSFMDPLKTYYSEQVRNWMNQNLRPLTLDVVVQLFGKAYLQVLDLNIGIQGFRDTGIIPLNPEMVSEDFPDLEKQNSKDAKVHSLSTQDALNSEKIELNPSTSDSADYPCLVEVARHIILSSESAHSSEEDTRVDIEYPVKILKSEFDSKCMFCKQLKSEQTSDEKWIQCCSCDLWAHEMCAGYDDGEYICDYCKLN